MNSQHTYKNDIYYYNLQFMYVHKKKSKTTTLVNTKSCRHHYTNCMY